MRITLLGTDIVRAHPTYRIIERENANNLSEISSKQNMADGLLKKESTTKRKLV